MSEIIKLHEVRQRIGKRKKNKAHLDWVRQSGCCICGHQPVQIHHLLEGEGVVRGASRRADDQYAVPLCPDCHTKLHAAPESYQRKHGAMLEETAAYLWRISPARKDQ